MNLLTGLKWEERCFGDTIIRLFCCSHTLWIYIELNLPVRWHSPQHQFYITLSIYVWHSSRFLHHTLSLWTLFFLWQFMDSVCLSARLFFVIAILRTVRGHEILKFTFKSELVSKSETINKSLWSSGVGEVSYEVNSYSTHLPVFSVGATQGRNCFGTLCMQTHACTRHDGGSCHENTWA